MKFEDLTISREKYGVNTGKLSAKITVGYNDTVLDITLPENILGELMALVAPVIAAQVQIGLSDISRDHEAFMLEHDSTIGEVVTVTGNDEEEPL